MKTKRDWKNLKGLKSFSLDSDLLATLTWAAEGDRFQLQLSIKFQSFYEPNKDMDSRIICQHLTLFHIQDILYVGF